MSTNINILSPATEELNVVVPAQSSIRTEIDYRSFLNGFVQVFGTPLKVDAIGTIDPDSVSTGDANLINSNLTDTCYNNSSSGTSNKPLPAIDVGDQDVDELHVHWWNNTYTCSDWKLQGSDDGSNWVDIQSGLNSTGVVGTENNPQIVQVTTNYQYYRVLSVTGNNASWVVLSEMEAYKNGSLIRTNIFESEIDVVESGGKLALYNNYGYDVTVELKFFKA